MSESDQTEIKAALVLCRHKPAHHVFVLQARGRKQCTSLSSFLADWEDMKKERYLASSGRSRIYKMLDICVVQAGGREIS